MLRKSIAVLLSIGASVGFAQERLVIDPADLTMEVGDRVKLNVTVQNASGETLDRQVRIYSRNGKAVGVDDDNYVVASKPGQHNIIIISPHPDGDRSKRLRVDYPVNVNYPALAEIQISDIPDKVYTNTTISLDVKVYDKTGFHREDVTARLTSTENASVDPFYNVTALKAGTATITAKVDEIVNTVKINMVENPVVAIDLVADMTEARTGDVFRFNATAKDKKGKDVVDAPITFTFSGKAYDVSSSAAGLIKEDGRFVAYEPGLYTITASCGLITKRMTVNAVDRNIDREINLVGHGSVSDKHTSDFWIWEGVDGRDYAVTGTWGADGTAYFLGCYGSGKYY